MSKKLSQNLIKELGFTKNGDLTPKNVTANSHKKCGGNVVKNMKGKQ